MRRRSRPRQSDVARLAGVSQAAVSVVLNKREGEAVRVSEETRTRILEAVRALGYVANPAARSLAGGQNCLLGIFTYEAIFPLKYHDYYYPFLVGIEEEAEAQGYDLLLFTSTSTDDGRRRIYHNNTNRLQMADGAVLLGVSDDKGELAQLLHEGFPFVFVGRREAPGGELSYAAADYAEATAAVVEHMIAHGHRKIAYLGGVLPPEPSQDREQGYRLAHQRLGLPLDPRHVLYIAADEELTAERLRLFLEMGVTALVTEHQAFVVRLMEVAQELGLRIPRDLSLGLLNTKPPASIALDLTRFEIPMQEMGAQAVRLLTHMLANPDEPGPHRVTLPCTFVPGSTVIALPAPE